LVVLTRIITADERAYLYNSGSGQLITWLMRVQLTVW
jgi:hypothetical protein